MSLSRDITSQFAKNVTNKNETKETTLNAVYKKIGDKEYVQLEGSDILTPVTSTVVAEENDKVKVLIKDHAATIIGNITSPSARSTDVNNLKDEVDEYGNTIKRLDTSIKQQDSSITQISTIVNQQNNVINQHNSTINQHNDIINSINNTIASQGNTIVEINNSIQLQGDAIDSMNDTIVSQGNSINATNNVLQQHNNRITQNSNNIEQYGNTIMQQSNNISQINDTIRSQNNVIVAQGNVIEQQGNVITEHNSNIRILNSGFQIIDGVLTGLSSAVIDKLKVDELNTGYAKIDFSNIGIAAIEKVFADSGIIKDISVETGTITGELIGVTIKGDLIEANTLKADKLVVRGSDGLYYKLNVNAETVESEQTDYNSLNGEIITAKSITASKINVTDLVAFGATIGGFTIDQDSIHTNTKSNVNSPLDGLYFNSNGEFAIGNENKHIKYYKDENNNYIFDVRLDKLYLGASQQTADEYFEGLVELSAQNLTTIFKTSGGKNLLRNSVGFSGLDYWIYSGNISTYQDTGLSDSGSKFILNDVSSLIQYYNTQIEETYSISFKYRHIAVGNPNNIKVLLTGNGITKTILSTTEVTNKWVKVELDEPYIATTTSPRIEIINEGSDIFEITDLIIAAGTISVWTGYIDEVYGEEHLLDTKGLRFFDKSSNKNSETSSTHFILKDGDDIIGEISSNRVYSQYGEFDSGNKLGKLRTIVLDDDNIIEYI